MATMNNKIDGVKMLLKKYTLDKDTQPNLMSESCREMIAKDIVSLFGDNELNKDYVNDLYKFMEENEK